MKLKAIHMVIPQYPPMHQWIPPYTEPWWFDGSCPGCGRCNHCGRYSAGPRYPFPYPTYADSITTTEFKVLGDASTEACFEAR